MRKQSAEPGIPIGEFCQVQVGLSKYRSVFRGCKTPHYMLLDIPIDKKKPVLLPNNTEFVIRFLSKGVVYGFETTLKKTYTKPIAAWVVSHPFEIKSVNLRKSRRINTLLKGELEVLERTLTGAIIDLSEGGGLFSTLEKDSNLLVTGVTGDLSVTLPSGKTVERLSCRVRQVQKNKANAHVGLSFETTSEVAYTVIKSYYDECAIAAL